jgi:hypothetical protein
MLESRLRLGFGKGKELYVLAREICSRYKRDLDTAKTLMQLYPDRIKMVAYENIATNPLEMSRDIYSESSSAELSCNSHYVLILMT